MAAPTINLLSASSSPALLADATAALGASAGGPSDLAGLFQSILSATLNGVPTAANGLLDPNSLLGNSLAPDQLDRILGLLDQTTETGDPSDDETGLNADLLSQLLATLGANLLPAETPTTSQPTASTTNAAQLSVTAATIQTTSSTPLGTARLSTNPNPVAISPNPSDQPETASRLTDTPATSASTSATLPPTAPSPTLINPLLTLESTSTTNATRSAGRAPAVVLQTPISQDPAYRAPVIAIPVSPESPQPPVNETTGVKGLSAVTPSTGSPINWSAPSEQPAIELGRVAPTTPDGGPPTVAEFAQRLNTIVNESTARPVRTETLARPDTATPISNAAATPTPVTPGPATAYETPIRTEPVPTVVSTSQLPAANVATRNPQIAITVAQPVPVGPTRPELTPISVVVNNAEPLTGPALAEQPDEVAKLAALTNGTPTGADFKKILADVTAPVSTAPTVTPANLAAQLSPTIVSHLTARPETGETELQIRLDPPELGTVKVKIVSSGGELRAELSVTSEAVRQVVESQLPELRQKLDDAGVKVQSFQVSADSGGSTSRDDRNQSWRELFPADPLPPQPRPRGLGGPRPNAGRVDVSA